MKKVFTIIASIMLLILIITGSVLLILNFKGIYYSFIDDFDNIHNLSEDNIKENYDILIDYCLSFDKRELKLKNLDMSNDGLTHFYEVRIIFEEIIIFFFVSLVLTVVFGYFNVRKYKSYSFIKYGSLLAMMLPIILIIPLIFFFDDAFVIFHKILFNNDFWLFNYKTDPIILYLPEGFFMMMGGLIIFSIFIISLLGIYIYSKINRSNDEIHI